jgi:hypothetical protein
MLLHFNQLNILLLQPARNYLFLQIYCFHLNLQQCRINKIMKRRETQSKTEILEALKASGRALSHDMIQDSLNTSIDRATIYRVLNSFCEDGKVHKIVGDDGNQYFAFWPNCGKL